MEWVAADIALCPKILFGFGNSDVNLSTGEA